MQRDLLPLIEGTTVATKHGAVKTDFDPAAVIDAIERDQIEFFTAGPSLIDMLVAEIRRRDGADLGSLREIAYGTARSPRRRWRPRSRRSAAGSGRSTATPRARA